MILMKMGPMKRWTKKKRKNSSSTEGGNRYTAALAFDQLPQDLYNCVLPIPRKLPSALWHFGSVHCGGTVAGTFGWATYEYEYKLGSAGAVMQADQGRCTTIFRKQGSTWLIQHEHCSTDPSAALVSSAQTFFSVNYPTPYQQTSGCPIVGNTRSFIYHMPGGQFYSQMHFSPDGVCLTSEAEARSQGYRPSQR